MCRVKPSTHNKSDMLTGDPSLSKLSRKYFTDSPCEDDKERESVMLSKHHKTFDDENNEENIKMIITSEVYQTVTCFGSQLVQNENYETFH